MSWVFRCSCSIYLDKGKYPLIFLCFLLKGWDLALTKCKSNDTHWALYAKSVLDRTRLALTNKAQLYQEILQPSAEYLGSLLGVDQWAVCIFWFVLFSIFLFPFVCLLKISWCRWKYLLKKLSVLDLLPLYLLF